MDESRKKYLYILRSMLPKQISKELEQSVYEKAKNINEYYDRMYCILSNIDPNSLINKGNDYVIKSLSNGDIDPKEVGGMNEYELNPEPSSTIINEIERKKNIVIEEKTSELFECKCGARRTKYRKQQTRGNDEGYTIFIYCMECNRAWRINE